MLIVVENSVFDAKGLFSYSARFEPVRRRDGYPNIRAAKLFVPHMDFRFLDLNGYLSSVAAQRNIRALGSGVYGNMGNIETGNLRERFAEDYVASETTGDPQDIGPKFFADPTKRLLKFYFLTTYLDDEIVLKKDIDPLHQPEAEIILFTNSGILLQDVMEIMESELGNMVTKVRIKRLSAELYVDGRWSVTVDDGLIMGNGMAPLHEPSDSRN